MGTCNVQEVYFSDVHPSLVKHTDKTRGVPVDLVFRDLAKWCTGDGEFGDLFLSRRKENVIQNSIETQCIAQTLYLV